MEDEIPPLPKGFTPIKGEKNPPLPKGFTPIMEKKNPIGNALPNTLPSSTNGFDISPAFQANGDLTAVLPEHREEVRDEQRQRADKISKQLSNNLKQLAAETRAQIEKIIPLASNQGEIREVGKDEQDHYNFMQSPAGKALGAVAYLGKKATKGTVDVLKGAAYLADMGTNPGSMFMGGNASVNNALQNIEDKATMGLTKGDEQRIGDNPIMSNLGGLAEFAPAMAASAGTGGATFYLQGIGQGKNAIDQVEKSGASVNPLVKTAFILGTGAVNGALMGELGGSMFKSLPSGLRGDIAAKISADAIKEAVGKELTGEQFTSLLHKGATEFSDKLAKGGISALEGYKHAVTNLGALDVGNFALKKGVDVANDKPVFNETAGNLAEQLNDVATKQAPFFALPSAIGAASKLTKYSGYKNSVVETLMDDARPENVERLKSDIATHAEQNGWTPAEVEDTLAHVDEIAKVAKSLPKNLPTDKVEQAVDLVQGRRGLETELQAEQAQRKELDPAISDLVTPKEEMLTAKIEQANDKLRDIATGKKTTYSKGVDEDDGIFFKTVDGKKEEISPARYELEVAERPSPETEQLTNQQENESISNESQVGEQSDGQENGQSGNEENGGKSEANGEEGGKEKVILNAGGEVLSEPEADTTKWIDDEDLDFEDNPDKIKIGETKNFAVHNGRGYLEFNFKDPENEKIQNKELDTSVQVNLEGDNFNRVHINGIADQLQNKGYGKEIYNALVDKFGIISTSEASSSKDVKRVWNSLINNGKYYWAKVGDNYLAISKNKKSIDDFIKSKVEYAADGAEIQTGEPHEPTPTAGDNNGTVESVAEPIQSTEVQPQETTQAKNATTEAVLDKYDIDIDLPKTKRGAELVDEEATKAIKDGFDVEELVSKIRDGKHQANDTENLILAKHLAATDGRLSEIDARLEADAATMKDGEFQDLVAERNTLLNRLEETGTALKQTGTEQGRALGSRRFGTQKDATLSDFLVNAREDNGGRKLTAEQVSETEDVFKDIKAKRDAYLKHIEQLKAEETELLAKKAVRKLGLEARSAKRSVRTENIDTQINDVFANLKKIAREQRSTLSANPIPVEYIPEIAKLVKLYTQKGINSAEGIIDQIYTNLRDDIDGLTKAHVAEAIAQSAQGDPLRAVKGRMRTKIESVLRRTAEGDFSTKKRPEYVLDEEGQKLRDALNKAQYDYEVERAKKQYENRTPYEKTRDVITDVANVPRALMASGDVSAPLRQGVVVSAAHPILAGKAMAHMFKAFANEKTFNRWFYDLKESPDYDGMVKSKLYIADPHKPELAAKEEQFMSNLANRIPVIGKFIAGSERAYVGYLNKLRVDLFRQMSESFARDGKTPENSPELFKGAAKFINNATGRGDFTNENIAQALNTVFFSPRLMASRVNLLNPLWYAKLPKEVRYRALADMAKFVGVGLSVLALAKANGASVDADPRSSDFGKIKIGDRRWDIWGGFSQWARLIGQELTNETKSTSTGEINKMGGGKFGAKSRGLTIATFFRNKLSPVPAYLTNAAFEKDAIGKPFDPLDPATVGKNFAPLVMQDTYQAIKQDGIKGAVTTGIPAAFGVGVQSYSDVKEVKPPAVSTKIEMSNGDSYSLSEAQLAERSRINQEYIDAHRPKLEKQFTRMAEHNKNLQETIANQATKYKKNGQSAEYIKAQRDAAVQNFVNKQIAKQANKHSKIILLKKYKKSNGKYDFAKSD